MLHTVSKLCLEVDGVSLLYIALTQGRKSAVILYPGPLQGDFVTYRSPHKTAPLFF